MEARSIGIEAGKTAENVMITFTEKYLQSYGMQSMKAAALQGIAEANGQDPPDTGIIDDEKGGPEFDTLENGDVKLPIYKVAIYGRGKKRGADQQEYMAYKVGAIQLDPEGTKLCGGSRRFRTLLALHKELSRTIPKVANMTFPQKKMFGVTDEFLDTRQAELNEYVERISGMPEVQNNKKFRQYFGFQSNTEQMKKVAFATALQATAQLENVSSPTALELAEAEDEQTMISLVVHRVVKARLEPRIERFVASLSDGYIGRKARSFMDSAIGKGIAAAVGAAWAAAQAALSAMKRALDSLMEKSGPTIADVFKKIGTTLLPMIQKIFGGNTNPPEEDLPPSEEDQLVNEFLAILQNFEGNVFEGGAAVRGDSGAAVEEKASLGDVLAQYDRMREEILHFFRHDAWEVRHVFEYNLGFILGAITSVPGFSRIRDEHEHVCRTTADILKKIAPIVLDRLRPILQLVVDHDGSADISAHVQQVLEQFASDLARELSLMKIDDHGLSDESKTLFSTIPQQIGEILGTNVAIFSKQIADVSKQGADNFRELFVRDFLGFMKSFLFDAFGLVVDNVQQATVQGSCGLLMDRVNEFYDHFHRTMADILAFLPQAVQKHLTLKSFVNYTADLVINQIIKRLIDRVAKAKRLKFGILSEEAPQRPEIREEKKDMEPESKNDSQPEPKPEEPAVQEQGEVAVDAKPQVEQPNVAEDTKVLPVDGSPPPVIPPADPEDPAAPAIDVPSVEEEAKNREKEDTPMSPEDLVDHLFDDDRQSDKVAAEQAGGEVAGETASSEKQTATE